MRKYFGSVLVVLFAAVTLSACRISANFYEIDKGKFYRSAQLTGDELQTIIDKFGVRTVVNLRGASPGKDWFDDEKKVVDANGVNHVNIKMSASRLPHRADLITLLDAFRDSPRPLLVHCKAGADRAGEASAVYQFEYMDLSKREASKMLSPKYFHLKMFMPAKDYFFDDLYVDEAWARTVYDPCAADQDYKYYDKKKYCTEDGSSIEDVAALNDEEDT